MNIAINYNVLHCFLGVFLFYFIIIILVFIQISAQGYASHRNGEECRVMPRKEAVFEMAPPSLLGSIGLVSESVISVVFVVSEGDGGVMVSID
jgi:hypothetical protein